MLAAGIEPGPHPPVIGSAKTIGSAAGRAIIVVADGSRSWSGAESDVIIHQLWSRIAPGWSVYVTWFDAETPHSGQLLLDNPNRGLVRVQPRTPLKEAIALALKERADLNAIAALVVVAHEQISPTYVPTDQLISSLTRSEVPVHTIHLCGRPKRPNVFSRLRRSFVSGSVWLIEALIEEDRKADSVRNTGRMLRAMSDQTGGTSCVAPDRNASLRCADTIAARIIEPVTAGAEDRSITGSDPKP
jgi:hypothetical protein